MAEEAPVANDTTVTPPGADAELMQRMFATMHLIRTFEERAAEEYMRGNIGGFLHLAIGEEAAVVGSVLALRPTDPITSTYREHGQALARGSEPRVVMAELFGRETGLCHGHGGSMHLMDRKRFFFGGYGIVGGSIPLAVGLGFAISYRHEDGVALAMFGDGATNQGVLAECMNMAKLWSLPVIFFCLNNQYGMGTAVDRASAETELSKRADAFGIPAHRIDGMDVLAVHQTVSDAAHHARSEQDPVMIEAIAYRYRGHSMSDPDRTRPEDEKARWRARDPMVTFERILLGEGLVTAEDLAAVRDANQAAVDDAVAFADDSPPVPETALADVVYTDPWNDDPRGSARMPRRSA
jgi:pyruvate dehydrogenase E1 component alpha subunit